MNDSKHTQHAGHRVLTGTGIVFIAHGLGAVLFLLAQRDILSTLPKDQNGDLFLLQRTVDLAMLLLVELGMSQVATRNLIKMPDKAAEIIGTIIKIRFVLWAVVALGFIIGSELYAPASATAVQWLLVFYFFSGRTAIMRVVFESRHRARTSLTLPSLTHALDALLFTILIHLDAENLNPERILYWSFVSVVPGFIIMFVASGDWRLIFSRFDAAIARDLFKECAPIFVANLLLQISDKSDMYFIEIFSSRAENGVYSAASKVYIPFVILSASFAAGIFPAIARFHQEDLEKCKRYIFRGLKLLLLAAVAMSLLVSLATPWVITLLTEGRYSGDFAQFAVFPWISVPNFVITYVMMVNVTLGRQQRNNRIALALLIVSVIANLALTSQFESMGAILAKMATNIVAAQVSLQTIAEYVERPWRRELFTNFALLVLLTLAATYLLLVSFPTLIGITLAMPIFVVLVLATRSVRKPELEMLRTFSASLFERIFSRRGS